MNQSRATPFDPAELEQVQVRGEERLGETARFVVRQCRRDLDRAAGIDRAELCIPASRKECHHMQADPVLELGRS